MNNITKKHEDLKAFGLVVFGIVLNLVCGKIVGLLPFSNGTGGQTAANLPFFMGNLMNYGMAGLIWGCVLFVLIVLMYVPFVKAYDKQLLDAEAANAQE